MFLATAALGIFAFLFNLGMLPLLADEPTRTLVALEMMIRGEFIDPTIIGVPYYKKPPLYNWILIGFFRLADSSSEFIIRLPSVLSLFLFGGTLIWWFSRYVEKNVALITGLAYIVSGRILVYASLLGHIDIFYSWVTFGVFIVIYEGLRREKWLPLFFFAYFLSAVGFLQKGLPSLVFLGFTLLAVFVVWGKFRKLFHWQHMVGSLGMLLPMGAYYYLYAQEADMKATWDALWWQSSQRTALETGVLATVIHLFTYPFVFLGNLAPWGSFALTALRKSFWQRAWQNPFLRYCIVVFAVNIPVYWLSPDTRPRYVFMLYPFALLILVKAYMELPHRNRLRLGLEYFFAGLLAVLTAGALVPFFWPEIHLVPGWEWKSLLVAALMAGVTVLYFRRALWRPLLLVSALCVFKLGFSFFVIPHRYVEGPQKFYKRQAIELAKLTRGEEVYVLKDHPMNHDFAHYYTAESNRILSFIDSVPPPGNYLAVRVGTQLTEPHDSVFSFYLRHKSTRMKVVRIRKAANNEATASSRGAPPQEKADLSGANPRRKMAFLPPREKYSVGSL